MFHFYSFVILNPPSRPHRSKGREGVLIEDGAIIQSRRYDPATRTSSGPGGPPSPEGKAINLSFLQRTKARNLVVGMSFVVFVRTVQRRGRRGPHPALAGHLPQRGRLLATRVSIAFPSGEGASTEADEVPRGKNPSNIKNVFPMRHQRDIPKTPPSRAGIYGAGGRASVYDRAETKGRAPTP